MKKLQEWKEIFLSLGWTERNANSERFTVDGEYASRGVKLRIVIFAEAEGEEFTATVSPVSNHMDREIIRFTVSSREDLTAGLKKIQAAIESRKSWKITADPSDYFAQGPTKE